jgi:hypothetical protein
MMDWRMANIAGSGGDSWFAITENKFIRIFSTSNPIQFMDFVEIVRLFV